MIKTYIAVMMLVLLAGCKSFGDDTKEFAQIVAETTSTNAIHNNVVINWHRQVLVAHRDAKQEAAAAEYEATTGEVKAPSEFVISIRMHNPEYDATDPTSAMYVSIYIQVAINNTIELMRRNLDTAEIMDLLNESIQADVGLDPLFGSVKELLSDEEVIALVKKYAKNIKGTE